MRKEFNSYPGLKAAVQDLSQQGFGGIEGLPDRVLGARQRLEHAGRPGDEDARRSSRRRARDRRRQRLPARLSRARGHARPRARRPTSASIVPDIARTVSALDRRRRRSASTRTAGRRMDINLRLVADAALAARGPAAPARAHVQRRRSCRSRRSVMTEQGPSCRPINHADRERAITITGNVAPGHAQGEALAYVAVARARRPTGLPRRAGRAELAVRRRDEQPALRARRRHSRRVHGARVAVQLASSPGHGAHDPAAVGRRAPCSRFCVARQDAQRVQHDRATAAHGHREEELDHPGRLRERGPRRTRGSTRELRCSRRVLCDCAPSS